MINIGMMEHDAFGLARGSGGVNERGEVIHGSLLQALLQFRVFFRHPALFDEITEIDRMLLPVRLDAIIKDDDLFEIRRSVKKASDFFILLRTPYEDDPDLRVVHDVLGLPRRVRGINGNGYGADAQNPVIGNRPFGPVLREDADHLPFFDPHLQEGFRGGANLLAKRFIRNVLPLSARLCAQRRLAAVLRGLVANHMGQMLFSHKRLLLLITARTLP